MKLTSCDSSGVSGLNRLAGLFDGCDFILLGLSLGLVLLLHLLEVGLFFLLLSMFLFLAAESAKDAATLAGLRTLLLLLLPLLGGLGRFLGAAGRSAGGVGSGRSGRRGSSGGIKGFLGFLGLGAGSLGGSSRDDERVS